MELKTSYNEKISVQTEELAKLVCPLCYEYMQPPIFVCENGHGICELCHELLSECPICHSVLSHRRSSHLETLTSLVLFPCKQCKTKFCLDELNKHQCTIKEKSTAICLIGQVYGDCAWTGPATNMVEHCRLEHPQNYWTKPENLAQWRYSHLSSIGIQNVFLLKLTESVFVIVQTFDSETRSLQWNISCETTKNLDYVYEIKLFSDHELDTLAYRSTIVNSDNIMAFFPNDNAIVIPLEQVSDFLSGDNFVQYKVSIHKKIEFQIEHKTYQTEVEIVDSNKKVSCAQKTKGSFIYVYKRIKDCFCC